MARNNALIVEVIGDTSKLKSGLRDAQSQLNQFAGKSKIRTTVLDSTLADVRRMQAETSDLARKEAELRARSDLLNGSLARTGAVSLAVGLGVNVLGRNLGELGGNVAKLGNALSDLTSGNLVGFVKGLQSINATDPAKLAQDLIKYGDAAKATEAANKFASAGWDSLAASARGAADAIKAADLASRQAISFNAVGGGTFGITPLDPLLGQGSTARRKGLTPQQRRQFFDAGIARQLDRNQDIPTLQGQVRDLQRIEKLIEERIAVTKDITRKLNLEDQLALVRREERGITSEIEANAAREREAAKRQAAAAREAARLAAERAAATRLAQRTARQFRELGLGPDGNEVTPGVLNLRKRVENIQKRVEGTKFDTPKLETQLVRFRKVLSEGLVPKDVRAKIDSMLEDINRAISQNAKPGGPLTKATQLSSDRILAGLSLGRDDERTIRARLSHFNSNGTALSGSGSGSQPITVNSTITVDGKVLAKSTSKQQARVRKVNTSQRNGPQAGRRPF